MSTTNSSDPNLKPVTKADLEKHEEREVANIHEMTTSLLQRILGREGLMLLVFTGVVSFGTFYAVRAFGQTLDDRVDAGTGMLAERHQDLEARFTEHVKDSGQAHLQLKQDLHEVQMDIRALYRAVQTGARQERLERPPPDGG